MQNLAQTIFGPEAINDPVPATIDWISFPVLQRKLQDFLSQLQSICSPEEFNKITQFSVSLDDCISTGIKAKLFPA